jgi:hypothetical protein
VTARIQVERSFGGRGSKAFEKPCVGATAGFPDGEMAAVRRGDGPAQVLFGFLEDGFDFAMQVHIQERLRAGRRRDAGPDAAAIGSPVEAGDSGPSL